ncbi:MAG: hypothetical protein ACRCVT_06275 [Leadbetterella sp.]
MSDQILIVNNQDEKPLNKTQKSFNDNIKKIHTLKETLQQHTTLFELARTKIIKELSPIERKNLEAHLQLTHVFDSHYEDKFFKKKEKEKLADIVYNRCSDLMGKLEDESLEELYEKYEEILGLSEEEEDDEYSETEESELMKNMLENMFGIDLKDTEIDPNDLEGIENTLREKLDAQQPQKKKTKKQLEREEKQKEEELNISNAAKAIYKELVKGFHPDREQNEAEKLRKTEIMKRITAAYKKDDLYELLNLKIELLGKELSGLTTPDAELKYYNKMLREQIKELETSLWQVSQEANHLFPRQRYDFFYMYGKDPKKLDTYIRTEHNRIKKSNKELEDEIIALKNKEYARVFLKDYEIDDYDDFYR